MRLDGIDITVSVIPWTYIAGTAAVATVLVLLSKKILGPSSTRKNGVQLPPGPPARWFWENPMPKKHTAYELAALVDKYGPIVSLRSGSDVTIVVGRMDAASEIMEKEGGTLVDRPRLVAAGEILSGGMRLLFEPAGERFRRLRRTAHTHLQPKAAQTYEGIQDEAAKEVILDILNDPKRHIQHARKYAASVILRVTYGKLTPTSADDPEVLRVLQVSANFHATLRPGAFLVDRIPWLKNVPLFTRQLREFHQYELELFRNQLNRVRTAIEEDNASPSFAKMLLEHTKDHQLSDDEMAYLAGSFFGAGSDTTSAGISMMMMAAACHPDAQACVQEELDNVVGRNRVPTFDDWNMLPQLQAFLLEALRWRPVSPLGFAHRAMNDVIWRGQYIPAGATVIGAHWSISRDPVAFPDPETFNPGRWLTADRRVRTDMHSFAFGFGRRVCPGQHVANRSLYINLALLLWSFRILQRPDAPIYLGRGSFRDAAVLYLEPFELDFKPRIDVQQLRELMAQ